MTIRKRRFAPAFALLAMLAAGGAACADDLPVTVKNGSEPELCAEKDNVALDFSSPTLKSLRIQAVHPSFIGGITMDRWAPDFTSCDMSRDPSFATQAKRVTFYEDNDLWLTGYAYPSFWRPATVPVRVGNRVETGLHIIQVWVRFQERAEEVLVVYPPDGYWRARPLPPAHMRWTAYGSSFLVGPVEIQERPIVDIKEIVFDPARKRFTMTFARGGSATLTISTLDQDRIILDVEFDGPRPASMPFAALRSMYTTETNADVAKVEWRVKDAKGWSESPIMSFPGGPDVTELWAGRQVLSRHNTSAPDMVFNRFSAGPVPPPKK
jgi:hypothetical protein